MQWNEITHKIPPAVAGLKIRSFHPLTVHGKARRGGVVYGLQTDTGVRLVLATLFPHE